MGNNSSSTMLFMAPPSIFNLSGITKTDDILYFSDTSILNALENSIEVFNYDINSDTTIDCDVDTGYIAFESQIGFRGLRFYIEAETTELESNNNLFDYNDPDDHFIDDDFIRTIVNQDLKFGLGNSLYKFINKYTLIKIEDSPSLMDCIDNSSGGTQLMPCLVNPQVEILNEGISQLDLRAQFYYDINSLTLNFTNSSIGSDSYYWDFGDGNYSTQENPIHTYFGYGSYDVTLVVGKTLDDGEIVYSKTKSSAKLNGDCDARFNYNVDEDNTLMVEFIDKSLASGGSTLYSWYWDFGDGNYSTQQDPTHTYATKGEKNVILRIKDMSDCEDFTGHIKITVGQSQECLKNASFSETCTFETNHKVKIKITFSQRWTMFQPKIKAKIIHYQENIFGWYFRKKTNKISVSLYGVLYNDTTCNSSNTCIYTSSDPLRQAVGDKRKAKIKYKSTSLMVIPSEVYFNFSLNTKVGDHWSSGNIYFNDKSWTCPN